MVVVADTSPLNYLVLIDKLEVLQGLYDRIAVPAVVISELRSSGAPPSVQHWALSLPDWIEVHDLGSESLGQARWPSLDRGEQEALQLATILHADIVLIDERTGARPARRSGFRVTGTLGVLDIAATQGLLDFATAIEKLKGTTFRYPRALVDELLNEHAARKPK